MDFDRRVGNERSQFATQVAVIDKDILEQITKNFTGKEPLEFYEGLLAGYACCYSILNGTSEEDSKNVIGGIIAYISSILEERG
jgi:hypothetical protein